MATMNISLPDPLRDYVQDQVDRGRYGSASDYVRDLIRRDQDGIKDETTWLRALDDSIATSLAEMRGGHGIDLDTACDNIIAEWRTADDQPRR